MRLIRRFNKRDTPYVVADEVFVLTDGAGERYLDHDNVNEKTIEIFTEPQRQGNQVLNYTMEKRDGAEWKIWLKVFAQKEQVYLSYESLGDTVEADDINELQQAAVNIDAELQAEKRAAEAHREDRYNPHMVTREQLGLGQVENTSDADKPVSTAQALAVKAVQEDVTTHKARVDNPHSVTKVQVGLGLVDNVKQASKAEFDSHNVDSVRHLTAAERTSWSDKYTKNEVDNKFSALETAIDWKESVDTFADIAENYPDPVDGWTVNVKDSDYTYRYSGAAWVAISANAIPKATVSVDGLLSKEDKTALEDVNARKHTHGNTSVLDGITAALITGWNGAVTHIADVVKHITAAERTKLTGIADGANNYTHPSTHPASMVTGLASVAVSGNYEDLTNKPTAPGTAPPSGAAGGSLSGTYPNPSVKDNSHAHTIANVTSLQTVLDGKAATAHTHGYLPVGGITWNQLKGV